MSDKPDPIVPKDWEIFAVARGTGSPADFVLRIVGLGDINHDVMLTRAQAGKLAEELIAKTQT